jgi:hypothetical protein
VRAPVCSCIESSGTQHCTYVLAEAVRECHCACSLYIGGCAATAGLQLLDVTASPRSCARVTTGSVSALGGCEQVLSGYISY